MYDMSQNEDKERSSIKSFVPLRKLGVLGGMGPAASAEFLRLLAVKAPASKDQEHPIVYMISDPQIPDRSSSLQYCTLITLSTDFERKSLFR
jgi:hypothetical protein